MIPNVHFHDPSFWSNIAKPLSLDSAASRQSEISFNNPALHTASMQLHRDGYLNLPPLFSELDLTPIKEGIIALKEAGLPPVFIYMYDQPWFLFSRLRPLIAHFLSDDFALLPNFWAWNLGLEEGAHGWPPHQDCQAPTRFDDGNGSDILMSLSLWIPLSDATADNGCMNVLPRQFEACYDDVPDNLADISPNHIQSLPAKAGAVLGWPQDLVHWGGTVTEQAAAARISLSLEFQNPAFAPLQSPLLDISNPPTIAERLNLILAQFPKYQHMETLDLNAGFLTS